MRYRVTNVCQGARVIYDVNRNSIFIAPGKSVECTLDEETALYIHERAIAGVGPKIVRLREPEAAPPAASEETGEPKPSKLKAGKPKAPRRAAAEAA